MWDMMRYGDKINERTISILLECILVDIALNFKTEIGPTFRINLRQDILARLK